MTKSIKFLFSISLFLCSLSIYAQIEQLNLKPLALSDDAEQNISNGSVNLTSSDLELGGYDGANNQIVGIRFPNVTLPIGVSIVSSYIQFSTDETDSVGDDITIKAQQGNALTYSATTNNISDRIYTGSSVNWSVPGWNTVGERGENQRTSDLTVLLLEAMQSGFSSGDAIAFTFYSDTQQGKVIADSVNSGAAVAPELVIEYTIAPIEVVDLAGLLFINEVTGSGTPQNNNDWIELYNNSNNAITLEGISLSDDADEPFKYEFSEQYLNAGSFALVETDDFFGIKATGEDIFLFQTINGVTTLIDSLEGRPTYNTSYGRKPDGTATIVDFIESTPEATNNGAEEFYTIEFSAPRGLYTEGFALSISTENEGNIRYTTDSSTPTKTSGNLYTGPIQINNNIVIKAIAYSDNASSVVETHSYIINSDPAYQQVPLLSISTTNGITSQTERSCSVEYIDKYGEESSSAFADAGFFVFGNVSTGESKKNFRFKFRSQYGYSKFEHPIFEQQDYEDYEPVTRFNSFDIKSGQDATESFGLGGTNMSEYLARNYIRQMGEVGVHARHVHVFFNGEYHGVYTLREQWSASYAEDYFGGDKEEYDVLSGTSGISSWEDDPDPSSGVVDGWEELVDIVDASDFQGIKERVEVKEFIDMMMFHFAGDFEWEFRTLSDRDNDRTKLRFHLNDLDGFIRDCNDGDGPGGISDYFGKHDEESGVGPIELFDMAGFNRFNLEYNTIAKDRQLELFDPINGVMSVQNFTKKTNEFRGKYRLYNQLEYDRWGYTDSEEYEEWVDSYIAYLGTRFQTVTDFLNDYDLVHDYDYTSYSVAAGDIEADTAVTIINPNPNTVVYYSLGGDDVVFDNAPSGILYTEGTALPLEEGINVVKSRAYSEGNFGPLKEVIYNVKSNLNITGINYNPLLEGELADEDEEDYEFVLLTNNGDEARDVAGYYFDGFNFEFPEGAIIGAGETVMIVKNLEIYPALTFNRFLWTEGGKLKNSGEELALFTDTDRVINQLTYEDENPWPEEADGNGSYLKLIENDLDNTIAENWEAVALPEVLSSLSAEDFIIENQVSIFPVPVNDVLNISLKKLQNNISASIYDVSGKRLMQVNETNKQDLKIDISNFSAGVYILMLDVNNTRVLRKVLKN